MKEKIVQLMKSEGLTSSRLAEILEIQPSGISHIVSGRNKPGFDLLQKILRRFPQINPDWLLLDSSVMYREELRGSLPHGDNSGASSSASMFDLTDVSRGGFMAGGHGENGREIDASILGVEGRNFDPNSTQFSGQNSPLNQPQNSPQIGAQNSVQNQVDFASNFASNFAPISRGNNASVERIIVLYSDGTFTTYNSPRK